MKINSLEEALKRIDELEKEVAELKSEILLHRQMIAGSLY